MKSTRADHTHVAHGVTWRRKKKKKKREENRSRKVQVQYSKYVLQHVHGNEKPNEGHGHVLSSPTPSSTSMPWTTPQWTVLTYLADELSELVQVALAIGGDAQLPDATVELLSSIKRVLGT